MRKIEIQNPQIKEQYEYLHKLFANQNLTEEKRISAYERILLLEAMILVYEKGLTLNEDEIEDLKIDYTRAKPLFPEHYKRIRKAE